MSACPACATTLPEGARFCPSCGARQASACTGWGAELPEGARFCLACGAPQPATAGAAATGAGRPSAPQASVPPTPGAGSTRRVTSVLFGDLVGFTSLAESRDQEEVRELLSTDFDACRTVIERYGGVVEKFIGDAVMAVWGAPVAHEDDAERAVRAGLELVEEITVLGERIGVAGLAMRVGIVTGEVAVTVGARGQGMVAGDPVNTAARVQSVAVPGTVWVDESTRQLTHTAVTFADQGAHELKGKDVPVRLWQALAVVGTVGGGQRADGLEATMVGRERELRLVKDLFHDTAASRSPSMLLVSGGPGLGKTRLGWEFSKYTDGLSGSVRWLEARCSAYGQAPFHALADAIRGRLRALGAAPVAGQDGHPGLEELLDRFLEQWVPDPAQRPWLRARTATLLGLPGAHGYPREELFGAWVTVLERMAVGAEAVVLLVDDAQYADDGLLDFLEFSLAARDLPLLVVLLTRPELLAERPDWLTNPQIVTTHLRELNHPEMTRLVTSLVGGLPDEVVDGLVERAAGVPLFAIETVGALVDKGLVAQQDDGSGLVQVGERLDVASLPAPLSLQALIASRLDLLPPELRTVVDLASVLGASFTPDLLADLARASDPTGAGAVEPALGALVQRQVLRLDVNPLSSTYGAYSFVQDVARQVAYSMLARRDRRAIHLQVADLLQEHVADAELPVIASHLAAALASVPDADDTHQLRERAVAAYEAAGDWAKRLGAWTDADTHYQHGVDLTDDPLRQATLLGRIAEVYVSGADAERGIACGRTALELAARAGDEVLEATLAGIVGLLHVYQGQQDEAAALVVPYWEAFRDRTDADDALRWLTRARRVSVLSSSAERGQMADVLLGMAQRTRRPEDLCFALTFLANRFTDMGFLDTARLIIADALQVAQEHDLRSEQATVLHSLSLLESREDTHASTVATRASLDLARELHLHEMTRVNVANLSICYLELGWWDDRDDLLAADLELLAGPLLQMVDADTSWVEIARGRTPEPARHEPQDPDVVLAWGLAMAAVRAAAGEVDGVADQVLDTMREGRRAIDTTVELIDGGLTRPGEVLVDLGDADALQTLLEEHCTIADTGAPTVVLGSRERFRGHLERLRHGPGPQVVTHLRAAVAHFERLGAELYTMRARHDLAAVLAELGEHEEATALREQVAGFYESLGATAWLEALHQDSGARA